MSHFCCLDSESTPSLRRLSCEAEKEVMPPANSSSGPDRSNDAAVALRIAGCSRCPKRARSCCTGVIVGTTTSLVRDMHSTSPQWPTMIAAWRISSGTRHVCRSPKMKNTWSRPPLAFQNGNACRMYATALRMGAPRSAPHVTRWLRKRGT